VGTDEDELNRVVISRCEVDMIQIKEEYEPIMKRSLEKHITVCEIFSSKIFIDKDFRVIQVEIIKKFFWN
jgi:hypothetical protein